MREGGHKLYLIREKLRQFVRPGISGTDIETEAVKLIGESGAQAAFKLVPNYHHATCININDVVVHGIPTRQKIKDGDLVCIDLGLYYKGFYTDTTLMTVAGKPTPQLDRFVSVGEQALNAGITQAKVGNKISDISQAVQTVIETNGYEVVRELTGHGVGKELHEDPLIPNFIDRHNDSVLYEGQTIAIEPMYAAGSAKIYLHNDGWTISTIDRSLSGLIEETVAITKKGPQILTK